MDTLAAWQQAAIDCAHEHQQRAKEERQQRAEEERQQKRERLLWHLGMYLPLSTLQVKWEEGEEAVIDGVRFRLHKYGDYRDVAQVIKRCPQCGYEDQHDIHGLSSIGEALERELVHICRPPENDYVDEEYTAPGHTAPVTAAPPHVASQVDALSQQLMNMDIRMARVEMFVLKREAQIRELEHALSMAYADGDAASVLADDGSKSDAHYED